MRITLRQLSVFRSLYETHRVSASAARLHLSPSAVSQSLKELESALGARLFVRESKGLTPTPAALTLLPYATLLVDKADEVEALFAEAGEGRAGTLAVGANRRFGIYVLSRRLMHMKRRMPAIETSLMIEDNDVVEDAVAGHLIDVGFISGRPTNPDLDGFPCFEDRFAFVVGLGQSADVRLRHRPRTFRRHLGARARAAHAARRPRAPRGQRHPHPPLRHDGHHGRR